ncbi:DUF6492 family protein [Rhodovulum sp. MB263]|uniref:DUF6492 family protein n=1 Tax=Rhodovulum sp. (strain MB263) TaxID=308754 RepID=UPI0009B7A1CB|nr:DUF6492 family protein [Rhodovulum sp. MB263]ARC88702.1 hypothetical protein B5V46_08765 [Rhodovulum sp. MB263]
MTQAPSKKLDIVTVVFSGELALLRLQARSIAREFDPAALGEIFVIINDHEEAACVAAVEAMRADYGPFADRLKVVRPDTLLSVCPTLGARLERFYLTHLRGVGRKLRGAGGGWRRNGGWGMQQVFKLLAARLGSSPYLLVLDAKNQFVAPVTGSDFVADDGRPRSRAVETAEKQQGWIRASFAKLALPEPASLATAPPTITPVVFAREHLRSALALIEEKLGPIELFFARRRGKATEFMLVYAALDQGRGRWWELHAEGLPASFSLFSVSGIGQIEALIADARRGDCKLIGIHRRLLSALNEATNDTARKELVAFWRERDLIRSDSEIEAVFHA